MSDIVIAEAAEGDSEVARRRLGLITGVEMLEITGSTQELAEALLEVYSKVVDGKEIGVS